MTTTATSIEDAVARELLMMEAADAFFLILTLDPSKKTEAVELAADLLDKAGEAEFARRFRECRHDGDRLLEVCADIDAEAMRRRAGVR